MKWIRFVDNDTNRGAGVIRYGMIDGEEVSVTEHTFADLLAGNEPTVIGTQELATIAALNPVPTPGKIVAIGLNYLDHCRETNTEPPKQPLVFTKFNTSLLDPGAEITWSGALTQKVDYEAELAVVIGRQCRNVSEADALSYVFGYTAANDVSARDLQFGDGQWVRGKSLDTFCPVGPVLVTAEDIPDPQTLPISSVLNGQVMQASNTDNMIFSVAQLISFCSHSFTLEPGDLILTGTPHGVGLGRSPEVYMQDGDLIEVVIDHIGALANPCRVL